ncbi:hypothetical protein EDB89DRAFT_2076793 [Lactarius sanguifluus]|nr:hypothetical protein EDB89DRAFT_2076793 [Lactarius sanguifluus]
MHMNGTRLSTGADWLARESAQGNIPLPIPPVSSVSLAPEPAPAPAPTPPLAGPDNSTAFFETRPCTGDPPGCFPRSSSGGTGGKSGRSTFSPANVIFAGVGAILLAAEYVYASQNLLVAIFERIQNFLSQLEISKVTPTPAMTDVIVKIMVEVLEILATATKEMKQSQAKIFLKKVAGMTNLEDGIKRPDKLTNEEARMANAVVLKVTHIIDETVSEVVREALTSFTHAPTPRIFPRGTGCQQQCQSDRRKVQLIIDDGKTISEEAKLDMQRTTDDIDDVKRS